MKYLLMIILLTGCAAPESPAPQPQPEYNWGLSETRVTKYHEHLRQHGY